MKDMTTHFKNECYFVILRIFDAWMLDGCRQAEINLLNPWTSSLHIYPSPSVCFKSNWSQTQTQWHKKTCDSSHMIIVAPLISLASALHRVFTISQIRNGFCISVVTFSVPILTNPLSGLWENLLLEHLFLMSIIITWLLWAISSTAYLQYYRPYKTTAVQTDYNSLYNELAECVTPYLLSVSDWHSAHSMGEKGSKQHIILCLYKVAAH